MPNGQLDGFGVRFNHFRLADFSVSGTCMRIRGIDFPIIKAICRCRRLRPATPHDQLHRKFLRQLPALSITMPVYGRRRKRVHGAGNISLSIASGINDAF